MSEKRKRDKVYENYNVDVCITKTGEKTSRIECKKCKKMIIQHATSLKRHSKRYYLLIYLFNSCNSPKIQSKINVQKYRQRDVDERVAEMIVENTCSLRIVESKSFKNLIKSINPSVSCGCIKTIKEIINEKGEECLKSIITTDDICIIIDGWTNIQRRSVLNIAVKQTDIHFLESVFIDENQTASNILSVIESTLTKHNIALKYVKAVCSDNAYTMKRIGKIVQQKNNAPVIISGCIAHMLNLVSKHILNLNKYKKCVDHCNVIAHKLNTSTTIRTLVKKKINRYINIRKAVTTRWSSYYQLFDSIIQNLQILKSINIINVSLIPVIEELRNITDYLCKKIHYLSRDSSSLAEGYKVLSKMKKELVDITTEKEEVKKIFQKEKKLVNYSILILAEFLDVSSKTKFKEHTINSIKKYIFNRFNNVVNKSITDELYYFQKRKIYNNCPTDIYSDVKDSKIWYNSYGCYFPNLKILFDYINLIPTSSCYIERSFSIEGFIHTKRRNRLDLKLINNMMRMKLSMKNEVEQQTVDEEEVLEVEEVDDLADYVTPPVIDLSTSNEDSSDSQESAYY